MREKIWREQSDGDQNISFINRVVENVLQVCSNIGMPNMNPQIRQPHSPSLCCMHMPMGQAPYRTLVLEEEQNMYPREKRKKRSGYAPPPPRAFPKLAIHVSRSTPMGQNAGCGKRPSVLGRSFLKETKGVDQEQYAPTRSAGRTYDRVSEPT